MSDVFPRWSNQLPLKIMIGVGLAGAAVAAGCWYYGTPKYYRVGYQPMQVASFSHAVHAGRLAIDCRYCHRGVESSWHASFPTAALCMNCHQQALRTDPRLTLVREAAATGAPVPWTQIHRLPDFVYFHHAVHVGRGYSCVECHGAVHRMEEIRQEKPFSMTFCLDCHRNPAAAIRPLNKVTELDWSWSHDPRGGTEPPRGEASAMARTMKVESLQECSACHR
jgi:hypothetical protein